MRLARLATAKTVLILVFYQGNYYRKGMKAVEVLKQIKALPTREREKLFLAILALEDEYRAPPSTGTAKRVKWPDVEARARHIFGDRVLPNLVLLEREETSF
jgi:hypothetical protein